MVTMTIYDLFTMVQQGPTALGLSWCFNMRVVVGRCLQKVGCRHCTALFPTKVPKAKATRQQPGRRYTSKSKLRAVLRREFLQSFQTTGWRLTYPSEKYESHLGSLFPIYGKSPFLMDKSTINGHFQ